MGKILIVDDDPQLRQSFEKLLTNEGHSVQTAPTGEAGIETVRESVPDLVVMDGASHFFHRRLMDLRGLLKNGVREQLPEPVSPAA